jgi:hypothetical protein
MYKEQATENREVGQVVEDDKDRGHDLTLQVPIVDGRQQPQTEQSLNDNEGRPFQASQRVG